MLSLARSLGEFGAVKIVSGNITGRTQTATLVVEAKYQNFQQDDGVRDVVPAHLRPASACLVVVALLRPKHQTLKGTVMSIDVTGVTKKFGDFVALDDVTVSIPTGQLTALLGPCGGGKSTLLRIIAGLDKADSGTVSIEGIEATKLPPQKRNVGFVFQHYAVFKHMTVAKNVAFGLEIRKKPEGGGGRARRRAAQARAPLAVRPPAALAALRRPAPADGAGPARSPWSRRCCCSTSRSARSTRRSARSCATGCAGCTTRCT